MSIRQTSITLFRGDSLPRSVASGARRTRGETFAGHFVSNGLMAKFADGGLSGFVEGRDLFDLVLAHVGYERQTAEQDVSYRSPMLSFSEDPKAAFRFAERSQSKELQPCSILDATHFIWRLEAPLTPLAPGHYALRFKADPINCERLIREHVPRVMFVSEWDRNFEAVGRILMSLAVMEIVRQDQRLHYAELVDVVTFVTARASGGHMMNEPLVRNTLTRARRSREWLLYPMDPMADGPGYSSRFPMNKYLSVYGCYRISGGT